MASVELLICEAGGLRLAVPLAGVVGVTEPSSVTPLPFSPAAIDGLVLAMNYAVVQMTVGSLLGRTVAPGGVLVVAAMDDDVRALCFDSVVAMTQIEGESIVGFDGSAPAPHLSGRFDWNGGEVAVLDLGALWREVDAEDSMSAEAGGIAMLAAALPEASDLLGDENERRDAFLVVEAGGERYALPSGAVEEIMVVERLRPFPNAPSFVAGLLDRRGTPILALDTRRLLGHQSAKEGGIALVVDESGIGAVALLVERALGITFFDRDDPHPVAEQTAGIESFLVDESGRIIGVIDAALLMSQVVDRLVDLVPREPVRREPAERPASIPPPSVERLLTLLVAGQVFAVPLDRLDRIQAAVALTPLPGNGNGFSGMADVGEMAVPVLDLRARLGGPRPEGAEERPPCALIQLEGAVAGLAIDQVLRIETVERACIDPVEPHDRLPVSGIFEATDGRMASILMVDRLLPLLSNDWR